MLGLHCSAWTLPSFSERGPLSSHSSRVAVQGLLTAIAPPPPLSWITGSREGGLSSCGSQTHLPPSMQDLPGPGIELVSRALQGGFLTFGPPEKPVLITIAF